MKPDNLERVLATIKGKDTDSEGEIYFAEFDETIRLYLFEQSKISDYNEKCINNFFNWDGELFEKLKKASFDYYRDFVEDVGMDDMPVIESYAEVFDFCTPSNLIFNVYDKNPDDTFITIELNCEWEIEHGMQWTVKNDDELIFVGPYDGVSVSFAFEVEPNYARKYNPQLSK